MSPIQFIFLSTVNLNDRLFMRDFVSNFSKIGGLSVLIHEAYKPALEDIRFMTKRVSAYLSEQMVPNLAVSGDQRNLIMYDETGTIVIKKELMAQLFISVNCIVTNSLALRNRKAELAPIQHVLKAFRQQVDIERMIFFADNPMSPLGNANQYRLSIEENYQQALETYPEEQNTINRAWDVKPSIIAGAKNYPIIT